MNYIVFDLEASCWLGRPPHGINEVIEIGALKINRFGEVVSSFNKFVKPAINPVLSDFCKSLTSISQEMINRSKTFPHVIAEFQDWIGVGEEDYCLVSWGKYDKRQLQSDARLHKLDEEWLEYHINLKEQYKSLKKLPDGPGLKRAVKDEGFQFTGVHHRAISDAENTAKIFIKYLESWTIPF